MNICNSVRLESKIPYGGIDYIINGIYISQVEFDLRACSERRPLWTRLGEIKFKSTQHSNLLSLFSAKQANFCHASTQFLFRLDFSSSSARLSLTRCVSNYESLE